MDVREPSARYLVAPGFKQAEVGLIPEDWVVYCLSHVTDPKRQISYGIVQTGPAVLNGVKCLRVVDIQDGRINEDGLITTSALISQSYARTVLRTGDLVMPLRGKVGEVAMVNASLAGSNLTRGVALIAIEPNFDPMFFRQAIASSASRRRLESAMNGSALQEIPIATLRGFEVAVPPSREEQVAVGAALTDADALIESLEQLLAKKRQIKQGAMQELLTGQRRLPGFNGDWEPRTIGSLGKWFGGVTPSMRNEAFWSPAEIPWVSSGDVKQSYLAGTAFQISNFAVKSGAATVAPENSVVLVARSGILRKMLPVALLSRPMAINQDIKALAPSAGICPGFVLHALTGFGDRILAACMKSGTTVESIELAWLKAFPLSLPPLAEQEAIAATLSEFDLEIDGLESKLTKARHLKQAMMQALLTGRIRLAPPAAATAGGV